MKKLKKADIELKVNTELTRKMVEIIRRDFEKENNGSIYPYYEPEKPSLPEIKTIPGLLLFALSVICLSFIVIVVPIAVSFAYDDIKILGLPVWVYGLIFYGTLILCCYSQYFRWIPMLIGGLSTSAIGLLISQGIGEMLSHQVAFVEAYEKITRLEWMRELNIFIPIFIIVFFCGGFKGIGLMTTEWILEDIMVNGTKPTKKFKRYLWDLDILYETMAEHKPPKKSTIKKLEKNFGKNPFIYKKLDGYESDYPFFDFSFLKVNQKKLKAMKKAAKKKKKYEKRQAEHSNTL